jgi:hypothetical protein
MIDSVYHYTDKEGYNAVRASPVWVFKIHQPPKKENPVAAYFSKLAPDTLLLAAKLRVGKKKIEFVFEFDDAGDLKPLSPRRELHILLSTQDYRVDVERQRYDGPANQWRP